MNKREFLERLRRGLSCLPESDIEERLTFYGEMIDDMTEDGLSEEDAIRTIGTADEVAMQIISETPLIKLVKEKIKPKKRLDKVKTVLLIVGAPLWIALSAAALAVVVAGYAVLCAVILSVWAVFGAVSIGGIAGTAAGIFFAVGGHVTSGIAVTGAGLVCAGLAVFVFCGCVAATGFFITLAKKTSAFTKSCFANKEEA